MTRVHYFGDHLSLLIIQVKQLWKKNPTYRLKIIWDNQTLKYFRNDTCHAWHVLKNSMQLRCLCVGRPVSEEMLDFAQQICYLLALGLQS